MSRVAETPIRRTGPLWALGVAAAIVAVALAPASADARGQVPAGNLVANPTFERSLEGWTAERAKAKRVRARGAHGRHAVRLTATRRAAGYGLDDVPETVSGGVRAGASYVASAWVRAARRSRGDRAALVVRERDEAGKVISLSRETIRLRPKFRRVRVAHKADSSGTTIDLTLVRAGRAGPREAFLADAISLVPRRRGGSGGGGGGGGGSDQPQPGPPPGAVDPGAVTTSQIAIVSSHESSLFHERDARYRYILIRDSMHDRVEELRALHPKAQILLYKNVAFTLHEPGCPYAPFQGGGVSWCDADRHEDWFLHDKQTGARLSSDGYPSQRAMNIAKPGYRQAWIDSVLARLRDANNDGSGVRYDGVWLDDANMYPGHGMDGRIAELSDAQYRNAMVSFLDQVAATIEAEGFVTAANLGANPWEPEQRAASIEVAHDVSVVNREGFVRWGDSGQLFTDPGGPVPHWDDEMKFAEDLQAAGARLHTITYGPSSDVRAQRYARATFLLAWNGRDGAASNYRVTDGGPSWNKEWTTDVGVPTSPRYPVGIGWRRDFTDGTVVVNARPAGSQTYALGGSFQRPDGQCVSSVTLSPQSALVLPACG